MKVNRTYRLLRLVGVARETFAGKPHALLPNPPRPDAEVTREVHQQLCDVMASEIPGILDGFEDDADGVVSTGSHVQHDELDIYSRVHTRVQRAASTRLLPPVCLGQGDLIGRDLISWNSSGCNCKCLAWVMGHAVTAVQQVYDRLSLNMTAS